MVLGGVTILITLGALTYSKVVEVPSLKGKGIVEATNLLEEKGLKLKVEGEEFNMHIPMGSITRQMISSGTIVKEGRTIQVYISKGPQIPVMLSVEGKKIDEAEQDLLEKGIAIGIKLRIYSDTIEKDHIIAQNPMPGEPALDTVDIIVSLGPHKKLYKCPSFVDMTFQEASNLAKALGINLVTYGKGSIVVGQRPSKGTIITRGDSVEVSLKRDMVEEPFSSFGN